MLPVFLARSRCGNLSRASDSHLRVTGTTWSLLDVHKESGDPSSARVQEGKLFMRHEKKKKNPGQHLHPLEISGAFSSEMKFPVDVKAWFHPFRSKKFRRENKGFAREDKYCEATSG